METSLYQATKLTLAASVGLSTDALHVCIGLGVFFGALILFRKPMNSLFPLAVVLLAAIAGEALDMRDDLAGLGYWRWQRSLWDVFTTIFWPFVIWLLACLRVLRVDPTPR